MYVSLVCQMTHIALAHQDAKYFQQELKNCITLLINNYTVPERVPGLCFFYTTGSVTIITGEM